MEQLDKFKYIPRNLLFDVKQKLDEKNIESEIKSISGITILKVKDLIFLDDGNVVTDNINDKIFVEPQLDAILNEILNNI